MIDGHQTELEESCRELREALGKVVQSEKMVILGQMVAGIAHEINTPSGAINAAIVNMSHHMKLLLQSFAEFDTQGVTREDFQKMRRIVAGMLAKLDEHERRSSGEIRNEQKRLAEILNQQNVPDGRKIAKDIARMGLSDNMDELLILAHTYNANSIWQFLTHCNRIINSAKDIQLSIDMMTRVIQALKSYSYPWQEKPEIADIHESINTALILLNNKLKHRIHVELRFGELPKIWCYPSELSHVWINIIHNAIQAIKDKGAIDIETCVTEDAVEVKITDNGAGIPVDVQHQIFDINFTTKSHEGGTGLGLYIAYQIIEKHHGTVRVTSVPGQTRFEVRLPLKLVT